MNVYDLDPGGRPIISFPIYFDVRQNTISLNTYIATATEFSNLIEGFNREVFEGQLQYKIYVLPPEPGSFVQKLGIAVIAGAGFVGSAIFDSTIGDLGKGFIEGVVGRPLQEWGQDIGRNAIEAIENWNERTTGSQELLDSCSIPDDHIDPRRSAFFMARSILRGVRDGDATC